MTKTKEESIFLVRKQENASWHQILLILQRKTRFKKNVRVLAEVLREIYAKNGASLRILNKPKILWLFRRFYLTIKVLEGFVPSVIRP